MTLGVTEIETATITGREMAIEIETIVVRRLETVKDMKIGIDPLGRQETIVMTVVIIKRNIPEQRIARKRTLLDEATVTISTATGTHRLRTVVTNVVLMEIKHLGETVRHQ